nr:MAG TPA: hypothetical protein [Caudoviricetes sp.]
MNEESENLFVRKINSCFIEEIIKEEVILGDGTEKNPVRKMYNYWTKEGRFICQNEF